MLVKLRAALPVLRSKELKKKAQDSEISNFSLLRSFPQHLADKYLKIENFTVPVITMASDKLIVGNR